MVVVPISSDCEYCQIGSRVFTNKEECYTDLGINLDAESPRLLSHPCLSARDATEQSNPGSSEGIKDVIKPDLDGDSGSDGCPHPIMHRIRLPQKLRPRTPMRTVTLLPCQMPRWNGIPPTVGVRGLQKTVGPSQ